MVRVPKRLAVAAALSVAASVGLAGPAGSGVVPTPAVAQAAKKQGPIDRALARLQAAQNRDGGFGPKPGKPSDPVASVWAALALETLGIHPGDQPRTGTTILEYLVGTGDTLKNPHWKALTGSSDLAAFVLVARAAGPVAEAPANAAASRLAGRILPDGGVREQFENTPPTVYATALTTLALAKDPLRADAATKTVGWLKQTFSGDGWGVKVGDGPRPAATGLALQALWAVEPGEQKLTSQAQTYLGDVGNDDGGYGDAKGQRSDPRTTAWVSQGLQATGVDPKTWATGLNNIGPRTYLSKAQRSDGGFGDTLTTALALPGFNATGFVMEPVKRNSPLASRRSGAEERKKGAAGGGAGGAKDTSGAKAGGSDDGDGAKATPGGGGGTPSGGPSSTSSPGPAPSSPGPAPSSPATSTPPATPSTPPPTTSTPSPAPTPTPTTTATTPTPADDSAAAGPKDGDRDDDTPDGAPTQQVNGVVVGARAAAASTGPSVATGSGDSGDRGAAVLGGLIVALVLVGTQLERRRPRRIVS